MSKGRTRSALVSVTSAASPNRRRRRSYGRLRWWWRPRRWRRNGDWVDLHGRFHQNLFAQVQVSMESGHVFSDFLIICKGAIAKSVRHFLAVFRFATAFVGFCKRLYLQSLSSTSISFLADCIISETCYTESTTPEAEERSENRPFAGCDAALSTTSFLSPELLQYVLSSSTQVCFLRTGHRNVSSYNVFSTLVHAVDNLSVTFFDVIASRFVAHFSYTLQNSQKVFHSTTHCSIPPRTLNLTTNAPLFYTLGTYT